MNSDEQYALIFSINVETRRLSLQNDKLQGHVDT